ncbi:MAG: ATP-dependent zinc metalloprotease FtsH [Desulfohalobiaceae bacterium]|nr:ATP-dependent zinc metalloprotease FtsH [Desulfohalobiaceae bacterium]
MTDNQQKPSPTQQPQNNLRNPRSWVIPLLLLILMIWMLIPANWRRTEISYTEFRAHVENDNVAQVTVQGDQISGTLKSPGTKRVKKGEDVQYTEFETYLPSFGDEELMGLLESKNVVVNTKPTSDPWLWYGIISFLPLLLILGLVYAQTRRFQSQGGGIFSVGKSQARMYDRSEVETTFDDVAGAEGGKQELKEVVSFLREPEKIRDMGGEIPKGIMLAGYPGTGKTLLARAVAGEAGVPFFSITGSDFLEMFVGVGAKRVRNLFQDAKKEAPSIIFIDEIDAIARRRGAGLGGGHDEREQTLNQLLSELDGFEPNENVVVMTATNRPDILDPALSRPGRFDRKITVDLPTTADREQILDIYVRNKKLGDDVDLKALARGTPGFSGADLRNLLNEAALLAARHNREIIQWRDIEEARDKVMMGLQRHGLTMTEEEKRMVAYHESGHAIVGAALPHSDPVHKVSIIPRSQAMGATQQFPEQEQYIYRKEYMLDRLAVMMGGRCAETLVFGTSTSGAANDLQTATQLARSMVLEWGMSERFKYMAPGGQSKEVFLGEQLGKSREISERTAQEVDEEVEELLREAYERAMEVIRDKRWALDRLAEMLEEREEIAGEEVHEMLNTETTESD